MIFQNTPLWETLAVEYNNFDPYAPDRSRIYLAALKVQSEGPGIESHSVLISKQEQKKGRRLH
jgi:hypothetical protein